MKLNKNVFQLGNSTPFSSSRNPQQLNSKNGLTITDHILRWRWLLMGLLGLAVIVFEFFEHTGEQPDQLAQLVADREFVFETFLYGIILPLAGGLVMSSLNYVRVMRDQAERHLSHQYELNQQLIESLEWNKLINTLVKFPRTVIPITGSILLTNNESDSRFILAAEWWQQGNRPSIITAHDLKPDSCHHCANRFLSSVHPYFPQLMPDNKANIEQINGHCQPLSNNNQLIAVVRTFLPSGYSLTQYQANLLNSLAPSMALAVSIARARQSAINKAKMSELERQRIARDLHDSLGQNLAYLQLRLDQLAQNNTLQKNEEVQQELKLVREVANEAVERMRGAVIDLRSSDIIDLSTRLLGQAQSVGEQANFAVELNNKGQPRMLPPLIQRQTLYLFQEALTNIARYAQASLIKIDLLWTADALTITLEDNGQGFNPDTIQTDMELAFLQECATEMNGHLTLNSQPNGGTQITFQLPLTYNAKVAE